MLRLRGAYDDAETLFREALALGEAELGEEDAELAGVLNNLAIVFKYSGRFDEAQAAVRARVEDRRGDGRPGPRAGGVRSTTTSAAWSTLADATTEPRRPHVEQSRSVSARWAPTHPDVAADRAALAPIFDELGKTDEAEQLMRDALATFEDAFGAEHPELAPNLNNLAAILHRRGEHAEAERLYRRALAIKEQTLGTDHPELAVTLANLATTVAAAPGTQTRAARPLRRAIAMLERSVDPGHPNLAIMRDNLAGLAGDEPRDSSLSAPNPSICSRPCGVRVPYGPLPGALCASGSWRCRCAAGWA